MNEDLVKKGMELADEYASSHYIEGWDGDCARVESNRSALESFLREHLPAPCERGEQRATEDDGCPIELAVLQRFWREHLGEAQGEKWVSMAERRPNAGQLIVKRWKSGSVWAGIYSGTDKDSSFDEWFGLPVLTEKKE